MKSVKLVIIDDHKILLDGLISLFHEVPSITVVAALSLNDDLHHFLQEHEVDVILLDMHRSVIKGCEVTEEVKRHFPHIKVLVHTMGSQANEINNTLRTEVEGYILKKRGFDELLKAIQLVAHGGCYFDPSIMKNFINQIGVAHTPVHPSRKGLTPTELKVVQLMCEEKDTKTIAAEMGIAKTTLSVHTMHIYRKLRVNSPMGIYKYALSNGLLNRDLSKV